MTFIFRHDIVSKKRIKQNQFPMKKLSYLIPAIAPLKIPLKVYNGNLLPQDLISSVDFEIFHVYSFTISHNDQ